MEQAGTVMWVGRVNSDDVSVEMKSFNASQMRVAADCRSVRVPSIRHAPTFQFQCWQTGGIHADVQSTLHAPTKNGKGLNGHAEGGICRVAPHERGCACQCQYHTHLGLIVPIKKEY